MSLNLKKSALSIVVATAIFATGCSSNQPPMPTYNPMAPATYSGSMDNYVNGIEPTEQIGGTFKTLLSETTNGITRYAGEVTRAPGQRSVVHYMTYTVTSCVIKGQATLVLEGTDPQTFKAGECYTMPAGVKGYIANRGKTTLKLLDVNTMPAGASSMVMLEQH